MAGVNSTVNTIITGAMVGDVVTAVTRLVAAVIGAGDTVVAVGIGAILAAERGIAGFDAVTELPVVAQRVVGDVITGVCTFIAAVIGAGDTVVAIRVRTIQAAKY